VDSLLGCSCCDQPAVERLSICPSYSVLLLLLLLFAGIVLLLLLCKMFHFRVFFCAKLSIRLRRTPKQC
jgi:hypothetical protein